MTGHYTHFYVFIVWCKRVEVKKNYKWEEGNIKTKEKRKYAINITELKVINKGVCLCHEKLKVFDSILFFLFFLERIKKMRDSLGKQLNLRSLLLTELTVAGRIWVPSIPCTLKVTHSDALATSWIYAEGPATGPRNVLHVTDTRIHTE